MRNATNEEIYVLLTNKFDDTSVTCKELEVIGRCGKNASIKLKADIKDYAIERMVEAKSTDDNDSYIKYNIGHLKDLPTWIVLEYQKLDLDELARKVVRDRKALGTQKST